jgi:hypothetical protein
MPSPVLTVTLQAAIFSIASTILAQSITMYRAQKLRPIDPISLLKFMLIAIIMTPPNYFYQKLLEDSFPARPEPETSKRGEKDGTSPEKGKLSVSNTILKFLLDQSLGALANTVMFIVLVDVFKGYPAEIVVRDVHRVSQPPARCEDQI